MITRDEVVFAYRAFLGREPESAAVVEQKLRACSSLEELARHFAASEEFRTRVAQWAPLTWPGLRVDDEAEGEDLARIHAHVRGVWSRLGATEPYWSVLSAERFQRASFESSKAEFFGSGAATVDTVLSVLERNGIVPADLRTVNELGCGVGRVTRWLAQRFPQVVACDVSSPHLDVAREYLRSEGVANVELHRVGSLDDVTRLPSCDLALSILVLQHNPPPVMAHLVRSLLGWLKPRGVAFFQLPTYALGYAFDATTYATGAAPQGIEMHVLPQPRLFGLIEEAGCSVLEVREDGWVGLPGWISDSLLVQRRAS